MGCCFVARQRIVSLKLSAAHRLRRNSSLFSVFPTVSDCLLPSFSTTSSHSPWAALLPESGNKRRVVFSETGATRGGSPESWSSKAPLVANASVIQSEVLTCWKYTVLREKRVRLKSFRGAAEPRQLSISGRLRDSRFKAGAEVHFLWGRNPLLCFSPLCA